MISVLKRYSLVLILSSVLFAIIFGILTPSLFSNISFLGVIFLNLLKLFALPLICSALIVALGSMGKSLSTLKSLSKNVLFYMLLSEIIAVSIALILFNIFSPGKGVDPGLILNGEVFSVKNDLNLNLSNTLLSIFPENFVSDLAHFNLLPVVIFSIMFGIGCAFAGEKANPIINLATSIREIVNICLNAVMLISPIGIFALVGNGVAQSALNGHLIDNMFALLSFVLILILGLLMHCLWQFAGVIFFTKQNPVAIIKKSIGVFSMAFATSSSVATLPVAMSAADDLSAKPEVSRFMLPLCASINVGGMMFYEVAAVLFFSQVLGLELSFTSQVIVAIICILSGMAEGGIPETSMVSLVMVFKMVNIPLSAISILLPLDRIIDRFRTMTNIFGNMCGTIIVSKFMKDEQVNSVEKEILIKA